MKISFAAAVLCIIVSGCTANNQLLASGSSRGIIVSDDFESTPVGAIPTGFTKTGDIGVEEGVAHSGKHALEVKPAVRGGRFISLAPDKVAALGGEHWGRMYFKVKTPTPLPTGRLIHATFVDGKGTSPLALIQNLPTRWCRAPYGRPCWRSRTQQHSAPRPRIASSWRIPSPC